MDQVKFGADGLVPAIVQDYQNGEVLMFAFMNRESLGKTLETGVMHYWSRSRQKLWLKGESSGHTQKVHGAFVDCEQEGGACHTGYRSCFYREIVEAGGRLETVGTLVFDPREVY
jgi:phosphoribosyl-AMP cyclohydrolase